MADVRKEGPYFVSLKRIYAPQPGGLPGRVLLFAEGVRVLPEEVERYGLDVQKDTASQKKSRKPQENK